MPSHWSELLIDVNQILILIFAEVLGLYGPSSGYVNWASFDFRCFRSHCRSHHEHGSSWSNSRVTFLAKYHLSDFVSSAHKFPKHTSRELGRPHHSWHWKLRIRIILSHRSTLVDVVNMAGVCSEVYKHSYQLPIHMFSVQCYLWRKWVL